MVGSINKVILVGNLGADPKVANTASGTKVVNLNIATSDSWKDKLSGERKERTEWHRVVIFNPQLADVAEKYLRKGSKVYLEGQLQTRKWEDNNGQERYTTEIVLQNFSGNMVLLDGRGDGVPAGGNDVFSGSASNAGWDSSPAAAPAAYLDDDIPFQRFIFEKRGSGGTSFFGAMPLWTEARYKAANCCFLKFCVWNASAAPPEKANRVPPFPALSARCRIFCKKLRC